MTSSLVQIVLRLCVMKDAKMSFFTTLYMKHIVMFFIPPCLLKEHPLLVILCFHFLSLLHTDSYIFFSPMVAFSLCRAFFFFFQNVRNWSFSRFRCCSSTVLDLPLFIYSCSLSYHGSHVINHTSSHHNFSVAPFLTPLPLHLYAGCYFDKYTLRTHYLPLQCLWNVDRAAQYSTFACFQSSFLEPSILCCTRIL
jgi:hypothetical protein